MRKITLEEAQAGMVVAADVFDRDFDGDLPVIARGVELSAQFIAKLKKRGVADLIIVTPQGYRGAPGEILAPTEITENILFSGTVELVCDVPPGTRIDAGENVTIAGKIAAGCHIRSATGDIVINGTIQGDNNRHIVLSAANRITIKSTSHFPIAALDVRAMGEVVIEGDVIDSTVAAKGRLRIDGRVTRSKIYSQTRVRVTECGSTEPCQLLVKPQECRQLFQELLAIDKHRAALDLEQQRLQNTIDLVRKLGKDIERLPYQDKVQMAGDIKRFREVAEEIKSGQDRKERIKKEITEALSTNRIVVLQQALPQTRITIENYSLVLDKPVARTAFFVRNMRVEGAPFGE